MKILIKDEHHCNLNQKLKKNNYLLEKTISARIYRPLKSSCPGHSASNLWKKEKYEKEE